MIKKIEKGKEKDIYRDLLTQVKQKTERKVRKKRKLTDLLINRSLDFSIGPLERL